MNYVADEILWTFMIFYLKAIFFTKVLKIWCKMPPSLKNDQFVSPTFIPKILIVVRIYSYKGFWNIEKKVSTISGLREEAMTAKLGVVCLCLTLVMMMDFMDCKKNSTRRRKGMRERERVKFKVIMVFFFKISTSFLHWF